MSAIVSHGEFIAPWYSTPDGTFAPDAVCPHCDHPDGQVLGGGCAGLTVRCRCTNGCGKRFLHLRPNHLERPRHLGPRRNPQS